VQNQAITEREFSGIFWRGRNICVFKTGIPGGPDLHVVVEDPVNKKEYSVLIKRLRREWIAYRGGKERWLGKGQKGWKWKGQKVRKKVLPVHKIIRSVTRTSSSAIAERPRCRVG